MAHKTPQTLGSAVKDKEWDTVLHLLQNSTDHTAEERRQAVDAFINEAPCALSGILNCILPHCSDDQLDVVLTHFVSQGQWGIVGKILERTVSEAKRLQVLEEAGQRADDVDFKEYILPHCRDDQLDAVLTYLVTREMWGSLGKVLEKGVSDALRIYAVNEAMKRADDWSFEYRILPYCSDHQLDALLTHFLTQGQWSLVGKVIERGVSDAQRWHAIEEASKRAEDMAFWQYILPHCSECQLEAVLPQIVSRGLNWSVENVLRRDRALLEKAIEMAMNTTDEYEVFSGLLPDFSLVLPLCKHHVQGKMKIAVPLLVKNRKWGMVREVIYNSTVNALSYWTSVEHETTKGDDTLFWLIMKNSRVHAFMAKELSTALTQDITPYTKQVNQHLRSTTDHESEVTLRSILFILCCVMCGGLTQDMLCIDENVMNDIRGVFFADTPATMTKKLPKASFLSRKQKEDLLITLTVRPYPLELPSAVRATVFQRLVRSDSWDVILHVSCLDGAFEKIRRSAIQKAVEQSRWSMVKQWADYTMFDNQRWWVIQEAYKHKQWQVMLLLADHGLTEIELMWVRYRIAMYADWDVVLQMFEQGVDVTELREVVESNMKSRKTTRDPKKHQALVVRRCQLVATEKKLTDALHGKTRGKNTNGDSRLKEMLTVRQSGLRALKAAKQGKYSLVFFHFHRHFNKHYLKEALQMAIESESWNAVIRLVRLLRMDTTERDILFKEMFKRQQWVVCRALLDRGLSVETCLAALQHLMEMDQWSLVARVMEFNVGDAVRLEVLHRAMEREEGSVVWRCISTMQHYRLSVDEREKLFQQAFSREVWQAIKPLVEEKDSIGIRHRDRALLAAIEQHQWDVVDYCQHYHADINMKDDKGETPLHRAAQKTDWKAVEELVIRGADPNLLDRDGCSVMIRAIKHQQWNAVHLLITCLADIHQQSSFTGDTWSSYLKHEAWSNPQTPLQALITKRRENIINHSLMWCPDQAKGINDEGETTLHAIAQGKTPEFMYYQVVRGVNPLAVTTNGHSVLLYAVRNSYCPQMMAAECIRLGFSTHQPQLTGTLMPNIMADIIQDILKIIQQTTERKIVYLYVTAPAQREPDDIMKNIKSPFLLCILEGLFLLAHMLYESGACSYTELHHLYHCLLTIRDNKNVKERLAAVTKQIKETHLWWGETNMMTGNSLMVNIKTFLPDLNKMAVSPRSLKSSCRLVISHCLNVHRRYHRDVQQLPVVDDEMRKYLMFSDLTDPDYSPVTTLQSLTSLYARRLVRYQDLSIAKISSRNVRKLPSPDDEGDCDMPYDSSVQDYSYVTTPRSLASSCHLVIFAWLFFCSRGLKANEGNNSVPCSLEDIIDYYRRKHAEVDN